MAESKRVYSKGCKQKSNVRYNVQEIAREVGPGAELIYR